MIKNKTTKPHQNTDIVFRKNYNVLDAGKNFFYVLVFPVLFSLIYFTLLSTISVLRNMPYNDFLELPVVKGITQLFTHLVFISVFLFYHYKQKINVIYASKVKKSVNPVKIVIILAMSFALIYLTAPFISLLDHLYTFLNFSPSSELPVALNTVPQLIFAIFALALVPAVVEEFIFRGAIFNGLLTKFTPAKTILISALMFMLMHGSLQQTVYQFFLGLVFGYVIYVTGNLLYAIVLHFFNNAIVIITSYVYVQQGIAGSAAEYTNVMHYLLPIILLLISLVLVYVLCAGLKSGSFKEFVYHLKFKNFMKRDNNMHDNNIIVIDKKNVTEKNAPSDNETKKETHGFAALTKHEKVYIIGSIALGVVIWLLNTIAIIFDIN